MFALAICSLLAVPLLAQDAPAFRTDVGLVDVTFSVFDRNGAIRADLSQGDFEVYEDDVRQDIRFFARDRQQPLTLGLIIDLSGSVGGYVTKNRGIAEKFIRKVLTPRDQAFLVGFRIRISDIVGMTRRPEDLVTAIGDLPSRFRRAPVIAQRENGSPVYDATILSVKDRLKAVTGRKAILMFSDGLDNASEAGVTDVIETLQSRDTLFFALNIGDSQDGLFRKHDARWVRKDKMGRIAEETGGAEFFVDRIKVEKAFEQIEEQLRTMYEIGYVSSNQRRDGKFRKIEIVARDPKLKVRHRKGYVVQRPD